MSVESFSNDDGDGNENVKKAIGLLSKTTSLHVHHTFLYISLPLLHDYDVKMPSFTFYGERLSLSKLECGPKEKFVVACFTSSMKRETRHFHVVVVQ